MGGDSPAIEDIHLAHLRAFAASAGQRKAFLMLKLLARTALDLMLPPQCLACSEEVPADGLLCVSCFVETSFITDPVCGQCGLPLAEPAPRCTSCDWAPPSFRAARAALQYNTAAKRLILPFKYADRPELAIGLARLLLRPGRELLARADLLVPVPLHRSRLAQRGYNQAGLLARALGRITNKNVMIDALVRLRATRPLSELDQTGRELALKGAIGTRRSREPQITGRSVLLIDDVLTTGSTASACADALYAAGATAVDVLAIARVAEDEGV
jgi:ComF family protein